MMALVEQPMAMAATTPFSKALHHVSQTFHVTSVTIRQPVLHHLPQRAVDVAVVQQLVRHLPEEVIGIKIKAGLGAVPARIGEVRGLPPAAVTAAGEDHGQNLVPPWVGAPAGPGTRPSP